MLDFERTQRKSKLMQIYQKLSRHNHYFYIRLRTNNSMDQ